MLVILAFAQAHGDESRDPDREDEAIQSKAVLRGEDALVTSFGFPDDGMDANEDREGGHSDCFAVSCLGEMERRASTLTSEGHRYSYVEPPSFVESTVEE